MKKMRKIIWWFIDCVIGGFAAMALAICILGALWYGMAIVRAVCDGL